MSGWDGRGDYPQSGAVTVSLSASATGSTAVVFDPAFSVAPKVFVTVVGTFYIPTITAAPTPSGVSVGVRRYNDSTATTSVTVYWRAEV